MRVLLLTQLFQPEPNHLKGLEYAQAVRRAGVDLRVLTGFPNYPGGRLYPGYRLRPLAREVLGGVPITRVFMYPSHDRSALRRTITYVTFAASASVAACLAAFRPDVVHVYVGPMTLAIPAVLARALRGARVLLDVQDLWPDSVKASGMGGPGRLDGALNRFSQWAYETSDRIVVLSPGYRRTLGDRGVPDDRMEVVYNWCDESQIPRVDTTVSVAAPDRGPRVPRIVYAGNLGTVQALDVVLDAARILNADGVQAEFRIVGTGVELARLQGRVRTEGIPGVSLIGSLPPEAMPAVYQEADALLVHLRDAPLSRVAIPQKTQMCLAAGKPVLMGVAGDATSLVREARAGLAFEPESATSLVEAVRALCAMQPEERRATGERGREFYQSRLSFARGVREMIRVYEDTATGERR